MTAPNISNHTPLHTRASDSSDYRFEHLNIGMLMRDMRFSGAALQPGDRLPEAQVFDLDGRAVSLRTVGGGRPIALVTS